jgi:hypothetical protein
MNNLFTFGCSFTESFENVIFSNSNNSFEKTNDNRPDQIKYIDDYLNGFIPKSWPKLLGEMLGYNSINYGMGGTCNYDIFEQICNHIHEFQPNDIVIVEWTHYMRSRWPTPNGWCWIYSQYVENLGPNYPKRDIHESILISRESRCVIDEIYSFQKPLILLSRTIGFKLYFWAACTKIINSDPGIFKNNNMYLLNNILKPDYTVFNEVFKNGGKTISRETDGKLKDKHLGKSGHEVQAKLFYEHILSTY